MLFIFKMKKMKRNKIFKNKGRIYLAIGLLAMTLLSSCLKDNSPGVVDFSKSPALLGFQYQGFGPVPYVAAIFGTPTDTVSLEVTLSVASITLGSPVTATIVSDPAYIDTYNAANGSSFVPLDPTLYTLQNGGKITISPGQQFAHMRINFVGQNIDFTKANAIGLQLTSPSGAILTSNLNNALVNVTLKSIYAGTYANSGVRVHPVLGPFTFSYNVAMGTVDKTTIDGLAEADLAVDLQLHVNPDNTVVPTSSSQASTAVTPGLPNTYDPATKTFSLNYFYNTGAPRKITQKMVYVGP